jgi:hypothetical protein
MCQRAATQKQRGVQVDCYLDEGSQEDVCPLSSCCHRLAPPPLPLQAPTCLRLVFHDFGPYRPGSPSGGANASIQFELERPENFGLNKGW